MNGFVLASLILYINFIQNVKVCFKTKNGSINIPKSAKLKDLLESKYAYLHFLQHANYISGNFWHSAVSRSISIYPVEL